MGLDNWLLVLDETLTSILGEWDSYSTIIATVVLGALAWQIFTSRDPDTHPMLLARQSQSSSIRQLHQSPIYRSQSTPHGMDLTSGLNVKDAGISKWSRGRNGDFRDVWRKIVSGAIDKDGNLTGERGCFMTVLGKDVIDHDLDNISRQISTIGQYLQNQQGSRIAIYLPNSVELLATIFACAFYNLTPILVPFGQKPATIVAMLKEAQADVLVASVGSVPVATIAKSYEALNNLIWVVDPGSNHLDWNEDSQTTQSFASIATWQDLIKEQKDSVSELPSVTKEDTPPPKIVAFWQGDVDQAFKLVAYSHANLVAGISAQLNIVPISQRINPSDLIFPADSLSTIYTLVVTLAASYYNASVVLNSVSGPNTDLVLATQGIAPTIIVASPASLKKIQAEASAKLSFGPSSLIHWLQSRSLQQGGVMPAASIFTRINNGLHPTLGTIPGKLRLIFVAERAGLHSTPLSSLELSDIRVFTGARIGYALTAASVAGALSQTAIYDYRVDDAIGKHSHFGSPLSSVEVYFRDTEDRKTTDELSNGEIVVRGPAVVAGESSLGVLGLMREDLTLAYA